jgi:hypothetical protein
MIELKEHKNFFSTTKLRFIKNKYQRNSKRINQSETSLKSTEGEELLKKPESKKFLYITSNFKRNNLGLDKSKESEHFKTMEQTRGTFNTLPNLNMSKEELSTEDVESNIIRTKLKRRTVPEISLSKEQTQVLNLNKWKENYHTVNINDTDCLANKYSEIDIIYKQKQLQDDLTKLNLHFLSKTLARFYKRSEEEKATIFIQNINLSKENFKFDVFVNDLMADEDFDNVAKKNFIQTGGKVGFRDKKETLKCQPHSDVNDEYFRRYYDLKMTGELSKLTSIEYYNQIIRERERVENIYRNE